ncbi:MAG TPA: aminoglycoside phosphotransferase [Actinomycetota bacterium]
MTADLAGGALTPAMAALLGDGGAKLRAQELTHNVGNQATGGIWRVEGPAGRAVLKIATADGGGDAAWATSERGDHWNYWRREPLAYQTGFVHRVYAEAGLGAPGLLAAVEPRPGTVALWLEDVAGLPGPRWPVARLADLAERLGRAQAGWAGRDPPYPWLSRRWLRQYVTRQPIGEPVAWDHPLASAAWPPELRAGLRRLWLRRAELLDLAEALPQTTCHLDVWPMNLVARGGPGDEVVLLDWAFAGAGAVGEDAGNLIPDSVADALVDPALLPEIDQAVTAAYLAGLRMGGYRGRDAQVRHAIAVTGAAKYCWLAPLMLQRLAGGAISRFYDRRGTEELLRGRAGMLRLVADWGRSALDGPRP